MKISKVDHTKSGYSVPKEEYNEASVGVIYDDPSKKKGSAKRDLAEHIQSRTKSANRLYDVLSTISKVSDRSEAEPAFGSVRKDFNALMKECLMAGDKDKNQDVRVKKALSTLKAKRGISLEDIVDKVNKKNKEKSDNSRGRVKYHPIDKDTIMRDLDRLVLLSMRSSLKKSFIVIDERFSMIDIMTKLITAYCGGDQFSSMVSEIPDGVLSEFFVILDKDYRKEKQMKDIQTSIENQGVKVKVCQREDGRFMLIPSFADHTNKKYIFQFMCDYTSADEANQEKMLAHIRSLILLYLQGSDCYERAENEGLPAWSFGDLISDHTAVFDDEAYRLLGKCEDNDAKMAELGKEIGSLSREKKDLFEQKNKTRNQSDKDKIQQSITGLAKEIDRKKSEKSALEKERSGYFARVKVLMEAENIRRFRASVAYLRENLIVVEGERFGHADIFWIDFFEKSIEKRLVTGNSRHSSYRLSLENLANYLFKDWCSFIGSKFVDFGKAVYHFALPEDMSKVTQGEEVCLGEVLPEFRTGISSFEYERIKADESLERELSTYIAFAINNFARACTSDEERSRERHEDVLQLSTEAENKAENQKRKPENRYSYEKIKEFSIDLLSDADRRLLQFFGGKTGYEESESEISVCEKEDLFTAFRDSLNVVRNATFHYAGELSETVAVNDIANGIFEHELDMLGSMYRKKYYSNNVPMFYKVSDIDALMTRLYNAEKARPAQIPAFNRVLSRTALPEFVNKFIKGKPLSKITSNKDQSLVEIYRSSLYFVLKEIYYYDFIQRESVKQEFLDAFAEDMKEIEEDLNTATGAKSRELKTQLAAHEDFEKRLNAIGKDKSLGEICQGVMVEYQLQNSGDQKVRKQTKNSAGNEKEIYKHFRTILYLCMRRAFEKYLKAEWDVLRSPQYDENRFNNLTEEDFCKGWQAHTFDYLKEEMATNGLMNAWFVTAHFMNPKHLNHLIGGIRTYIQFTGAIERRASSLFNRTDNDLQRKQKKYQKILSVLEFAMNYCGNTSNTLADYFECDDAQKDSREYAEYLAQFVKYGTSKKVTDIETAFHNFCETNVGSDNPGGIIGIYYNGSEVIVNRNVVLTQMYGNTRLLAKCVDKISESEIKAYYKLRKSLAEVLKKGTCQNEEEQRQYRELQNMKNRIELNDIMTYSEILNDFHGYLIGWAYLRERDQMYFRLGYYYTKLFYGDSIPADSFLRTITVNDKVDIKDGAILYQMAALNTHELKVITKEKKKNGEYKEKYIVPSGRGSTAGVAESHFINFCEGDESYLYAGACFFENENERDDIRLTRNYIDHFKYFSKGDRSILDLYSEVYDRFFRYDQKLKKSVTVVLQNVLMRYFVTTRSTMALKTKEVNGVEHKAANIILDRRAGKCPLGSTLMTYKVPDDKDDSKKKEVLVEARSVKFLEQLAKILEYTE